MNDEIIHAFELQLCNSVPGAFRSTNKEEGEENSAVPLSAW